MCGGYCGNVDIKVEVISTSIEMICCGSTPGGRATGTGAEAGGGAFGRGAMGVFSLLLSWEDDELDGIVGDDGSGGRKVSAGSESVWVVCVVGGGIEDGIVIAAGGGGSLGIGNS